LIPIKPGEEIRGGRRGAGKGIHCPAVAVLPRDLVVVAGAVPAAGEVPMRAIGKLRIVEVARLVPPRDVEAAALDEEEVHDARGRLLEEEVLPNLEGKGGVAGSSDRGADPV